MTTTIAIRCSENNSKVPVTDKIVTVVLVNDNTYDENITHMRLYRSLTTHPQECIVCPVGLFDCPEYDKKLQNWMKTKSDALYCKLYQHSSHCKACLLLLSEQLIELRNENLDQCEIHVTKCAHKHGYLKFVMTQTFDLTAQFVLLNKRTAMVLMNNQHYFVQSLIINMTQMSKYKSGKLPWSNGGQISKYGVHEDMFNRICYYIHKSKTRREWTYQLLSNVPHFVRHFAKNASTKQITGLYRALKLQRISTYDSRALYIGDLICEYTSNQIKTQLNQMKTEIKIYLNLECDHPKCNKTAIYFQKWDLSVRSIFNEKTKKSKMRLFIVDEYATKYWKTKTKGTNCTSGVCKGCKIMDYCSKYCQKRDWSRFKHRQHCMSLKKMFAN